MSNSQSRMDAEADAATLAWNYGEGKGSEPSIFWALEYGGMAVFYTGFRDDHGFAGATAQKAAHYAFEAVPGLRGSE